MFDQKEVLRLAKLLRQTQKTPYSRENHVYLMTCQEPNAQPREIAQMIQETYGIIGRTVLSGDSVISIYQRGDLGKVHERKALCRKVWERGQCIAQALQQGKAVDWLSELEQLPKHRENARLLLLVLTEQAADLMGQELVTLIRELGRTNAQELMQQIADLDCVQENGAEDRERSLQRRLDYTRAELQSLKAQIQEQVEDAIAEEREQFFMQLNQETYGQILDLLSLAQKGFAKLREQGKVVPMEIRSVQTLVRCMQQFLSDYGVVAMAELGETLDLSVEEVDGYVYEGTPFQSEEEHKRVEVISPGWEIPERNLVISYPKVREFTR